MHLRVKYQAIKKIYMDNPFNNMIPVTYAQMPFTFNIWHTMCNSSIFGLRFMAGNDVVE